eukprot:m.119064 g.119064  ORF g.119064 m.119064 type:complete len:1273 (-) comp14302_c0_seq1:97-3915(-)
MNIALHGVGVREEASSVVESFRPRLMRRLPLPRYTARLKSTKRVHVIPELNVKLTDSASVFSSYDSSTVKRKLPVLHIALVSCEEAAAYKESLKRNISTWINQVEQLQDHQWLILHVTNRPYKKIQLSLRDRVFEKIRNDYGGKQAGERCLQIKDQDVEKDTHGIELWDLLLDRIQLELVTAFDLRLASFEPEFRQLLESPSLHGVNALDDDFCRFFLLKDTYALFFKDIQLYRESLEQYDELDKIFDLYLEQSVRDPVEPSSEGRWLTIFGKTYMGTCQSGLTVAEKIDVAQFHQRLRSHEVVIFEMRAYIFKQQLGLLLMLQDYVAISNRVASWVLLRAVPEMKQHPIAVPPEFAAQWIFLTNLETIQVTQSILLGKNQPIRKGKRAFALSRASLCVMALEALKVLKSELWKDDSIPPIDTARERKSATPPGVSGMALKWLTHSPALKRLQSAMVNPDNYDKLFLNVSQCGVDNFVLGSRNRAATRINFDMGLLYYKRHEFALAEPHFRLASRAYAKEGWFPLEFRARKLLLVCQERLQKTPDMLATCLLLLSSNSPLTDADKSAYADKIKSVSESDENEVCPGNAIFRVDSLTIDRQPDSRVQLKLVLQNNSPCAWKANQMAVRFLENERDASPVSRRMLPSQLNSNNTSNVDILASEDLLKAEGSNSNSNSNSDTSAKDSTATTLKNAYARLSEAATGSTPDLSSSIPDFENEKVDLNSPARNRQQNTVENETEEDEKTDPALDLASAREALFELDELSSSPLKSRSLDADPEYKSWEDRQISSYDILFKTEVEVDIPIGESTFLLYSSSDYLKCKSLSAAEFDLTMGTLHLCLYDLPECEFVFQKPPNTTVEIVEATEPLLVGHVQTLAMLVKGLPRHATDVSISYKCSRGLKLAGGNVRRDAHSRSSGSYNMETAVRKQNGIYDELELRLDVTALTVDRAQRRPGRSLEAVDRKISCTVNYAAESDETFITEIPLYFYFPFAISHAVKVTHRGGFVSFLLEMCVPCSLCIFDYRLTPKPTPPKDPSRSEATINICNDDFNAALTSNSHMQPGQRLSLLWKINLNPAKTATINPCLLAKCGCILQFRYRLTQNEDARKYDCDFPIDFDLPEILFTSSLRPVTDDINVRNGAAHPEGTLGVPYTFELIIKRVSLLSKNVPTERLSEGKQDHGKIAYSIVPDNKMCMIAGKVRGSFPFDPFDSEQEFTTQVDLIPTSPGLLPFPTVKLFYKPDDESNEVPIASDYLNRGLQMRVGPGLQHSNPVHISLY